MNKLSRDISGSLLSLIAIFCIIGIIVYSPSLFSGFRNLDDDASIVNNTYIHHISNIGIIFTKSFFGTSSYYRPMVSMSFMAEYFLFRLNPFFFHLINILFHIATAVFIYLILLSLYKKKNIALFTSGLFLIHPINSEAVMNISRQAILICGLSYVSAFYFYLKYTYMEKRAWNLIISFVLFTIALFSKETAITFPILIMSFEVIFMHQINKSKNPLFYIIRTLPYFMILILYFYIRQIVGITNVPFWDSIKEAVLGVATFLRGLITYFRILVFPYDLHFYRTIKYFRNFYNAELTLSVFFLLGLFISLFSLREKLNKKDKFFILWIFITLIPISQIIPLRTNASSAALYEHFLYLPSIGIFTAVIVYIDYLLSLKRKSILFSNKRIKIVCVGFLSAYFIVTFLYGMESRNETDSLSKALIYEPENIRIRTFYGIALAKSGIFDKAEEQFRRVLQVDSLNVQARISLGKALVDDDKIAEGIYEYEIINDAGKYKKLLSDNIYSAYKLLLKKYKQRLIFDFQNPDLYFSLGVSYAKLGNINKAIEAFKKAVVLNPTHKSALFNLATGYESIGDKGQAVIYFEKLVNINGPKDMRDKIAYDKLYNLYLGFKDFIKADEYLRKKRDVKGHMPNPRVRLK